MRSHTLFASHLAQNCLLVMIASRIGRYGELKVRRLKWMDHAVCLGLLFSLVACEAGCHAAQPVSYDLCAGPVPGFPGGRVRARAGNAEHCLWACELSGIRAEQRHHRL